MVVVGSLLTVFAHGHKKGVGVFVLCMAMLVLVGGFALPPLYYALRRFGERLGRWVGGACAWLLLVPFFYICFTLAHVFLALRGKDPLHRAFEPALKTYWWERPRTPDAASYGRQY